MWTVHGRKGLVTVKVAFQRLHLASTNILHVVIIYSNNLSIQTSHMHDAICARIVLNVIIWKNMLTLLSMCLSRCFFLAPAVTSYWAFCIFRVNYRLYRYCSFGITPKFFVPKYFRRRIWLCSVWAVFLEHLV